MKRLFYVSITIISVVTPVMPLTINPLQVHYQMLNVNPLATHEEINEGAKKMIAMIETRLSDKADKGLLKKKVEEAHAVLSNPAQRKQYDASLPADLFIAATFEHFERTGVLYQHERPILYESLNLSPDASSDEIHQACAALHDQESSLQNESSRENSFKKIAAIEALLTHPTIKKQYRAYSAYQLHAFSKKLANQRTNVAPWKSYYELLNLSEKAPQSDIQKAIHAEQSKIGEQLKKMKAVTTPFMITSRNKEQLLESIKKLLCNHEERSAYDLFLATISKVFTEKDGYYTVLKLYNDADTATLEASYKKLYNADRTSLQDLKGDAQAELRYMMICRLTAYTILSDPLARKSYDAWQKIRAQTKTRTPPMTAGGHSAQKPAPTPFVSNNRFVLKKGGGHQQRLSPLQARLNRTVRKGPGQKALFYTPKEALAQGKLTTIKARPVRRHKLKKRPGTPQTSLPNKQAPHAPPTQPKVPEPKKITKVTTPSPLQTN
jgi:DnaJ-class molecular chaperone